MKTHSLGLGTYDVACTVVIIVPSSPSHSLGSGSVEGDGPCDADGVDGSGDSSAEGDGEPSPDGDADGDAETSPDGDADGDADGDTSAEGEGDADGAKDITAEFYQLYRKQGEISDTEQNNS